jgi:hypothetical protein
MKKVVSVAAALFAVHAWAGGGSIVICESMTACRLRLPNLEYDIPTLAVNTTSGGTINTTANFWLSQDCIGDPDATVELLGSPIPSEGYWILTMDDWAIYPDGTDFSVQWTIEGCPSTKCINGTTGTSPDMCQL